MLLTNSALLYESQCGGMGGGGRVANEYSCAHHVTLSPNKLWRSTSIFNLWPKPKENGGRNRTSVAGAGAEIRLPHGDYGSGFGSFLILSKI
jgi:hypothetical protein